MTQTLTLESPFMSGLVRRQIELGADPVKSRLRFAHIPPRFRRARFDRLDRSRDPQAYALLEQWAAEKTKKAGVLLMGLPGNGKTTAAVAALRAWVEHTNGTEPVRFWDATSGLERLRRSFGDDEIEAEPVAEIAHKNALVLVDDLGQGKTTDWVAGQFFQLLNAIDALGRRVLITTNKTPHQLEENLSPGAVSRIFGLCDQAVFRGADRRLEN